MLSEIFLRRHGLPVYHSLAPRTFTKCMNAILSPLHLRGVNVVNYLDDWLLKAPSAKNCATTKISLSTTFSIWGLQSTCRNSKYSILGASLNSIAMLANLLPEHSQAIMNSLVMFKEVRSFSLKSFQ